MELRRGWLMLALAGLAAAQVIEFESGGLRYMTQTRNGVTIMFAYRPMQIRDYAMIQVAVSNGSKGIWNFKPQDFRFVTAEGVAMQGLEARAVVEEFIRHGGREDVVKLVTSYENGLYGMARIRSTNGYESRRQAAMAELTSTKLKAAVAASAIVLAPVRLKPGESTDGAVFFQSGGKPLGAGKLRVEAGGSVFEFESVGPPAQ